jgi:hypothetical protein
MKSRAGMEALINDHQTQDLDVLLIQEPLVTAYRTHVNHSAWRLYRPTYTDRFSKIPQPPLYINRRISTSTHRQILCNHPDVTAVKIWTPEVQYLLLSVYIQPVAIYQQADVTTAQLILEEIQSSIRQHSIGIDKVIKLIISGDFNRHHPSMEPSTGSPHLRRTCRRADQLLPNTRAPLVPTPRHANLLVNERPRKSVNPRPHSD